MIDGGVICNNPAFYAYETAKSLRGKKNIRIMSLGTGVSQSAIDDYNKNIEISNRSDDLSNIFTWVMNVGVKATSILLSNMLNHEGEINYVRLQTANNVSSIANSAASFEVLENNGNLMWEHPLDIHESELSPQMAANTRSMIEAIVDERYG